MYFYSGEDFIHCLKPDWEHIYLFHECEGPNSYLGHQGKPCRRCGFIGREKGYKSTKTWHPLVTTLAIRKELQPMTIELTEEDGERLKKFLEDEVMPYHGLRLGHIRDEVSRQVDYQILVAGFL